MIRGKPKGGRPAHTRPINYRETLPRVCANCKKWTTEKKGMYANHEHCNLDPDNNYDTWQVPGSDKKYNRTCGCFKHEKYIHWRDAKKNERNST